MAGERGAASVFVVKRAYMRSAAMKRFSRGVPFTGFPPPDNRFLSLPYTKKAPRVLFPFLENRLKTGIFSAPIARCISNFLTRNPEIPTVCVVYGGARGTQAKISSERAMSSPAGERASLGRILKCAKRCRSNIGEEESRSTPRRTAGRFFFPIRSETSFDEIK